MSQSLDDLMAGNARALHAGQARPQPSDRRPTAAVLACTDERVVPQVIFDRPPGRIYAVRIAGNVYSPEVAGSLEIAVVRLQCPLIVVMGHTDCTAVQMAFTRERVDGRAYDLTRAIRGALEELGPGATLTDAAEANVRRTLREIRERCRVLQEREAAGGLEIAGAIYEIETGRVRLLPA
jgi:carbonic anhydrase